MIIPHDVKMENCRRLEVVSNNYLSNYIRNFIAFPKMKRDLVSFLSPCYYFASGGWIRTNDLRVMRLILCGTESKNYNIFSRLE